MNGIFFRPDFDGEGEKVTRPISSARAEESFPESKFLIVWDLARVDRRERERERAM